MLVTALFATVILWLAYIFVYKLKEKADKSKGIKRYLLYGVAFLILIFGYIIDVLYNLTVGSVLFLQLPRNLTQTLTDRLSRILEDDDGWRYTIASFICDRLLHPFDEDHCR